MRRILFFAMMAVILTCTATAAASLPDINGWSCGELRTTALDTVSGNKGQWLERDYRTASGTPLHAVWIEGVGQKSWNPQKDTSSSDGAGATYKSVEISGCSAVLERHPVTGPSLSIKVAKLGVLTLESNNSTTDEELQRAAEVLLKEIKQI